MESYKRAIHTAWDYRVMWVLMGHTVPDTYGSFVHLPRVTAMVRESLDGQAACSFLDETGTCAGYKARSRCNERLAIFTTLMVGPED
jgi:hypothetical protein